LESSRLEAQGVAATKARGKRQSNGSLLNVGFGGSVTGSLLLPLVVVIDLHQLSFQNNADLYLPMLNAAGITASLLDKVLGYRWTLEKLVYQDFFWWKTATPAKASVLSCDTGLWVQWCNGGKEGVEERKTDTPRRHHDYKLCTWEEGG
jgi:hypothetical protein